MGRARFSDLDRSGLFVCPTRFPLALLSTLGPSLDPLHILCAYNMASLLERTLGAVRKENTGGQGNRRVSGGGESRASPYAVSLRT